VERSSRPTLQTAKNAILVGSSHISHGRSRPRERKAATDAVVGPVVFKDRKETLQGAGYFKLYNIYIYYTCIYIYIHIYMNMEVKKFSE
jgi:hypothetical protein